MSDHSWKVPKLYRSDDIIYHYTSTEIAINSILKSRNLWITPRSGSHDPIENSKEFIIHNNEISDIGLQLERATHETLRRTKQLCFCRNHSIKDEIKQTHLRFEKYGFAKPNMWERYADSYKGVCLAFSKKLILKEARKSNFSWSNINYRTYETMQKPLQIETFELETVGRENYQKKFIKRAKDKLFIKHKDYRHEREFRICSFSEAKIDIIDISKALVGIIVSNKGLNPYLYKSYQMVLDDFQKVDFQILSFVNGGILIETFTDYLRAKEDFDRNYDFIMSNKGKK